jgi:hypothetical protein
MTSAVARESKAYGFQVSCANVGYSNDSDNGFQLEMGKNPKLKVLVRVRVLSKAGSVRVRVLCLPSKFGFGSVRV